MNPRQYAAFDPNALGPTLEIELGGLVISSNANNSGRGQNARMNIGLASGKGYFETAFYGDGALLNHAAVGIATGTNTLSNFVGRYTGGYALLPGEGQIYNNAGSLLTVPIADKKVYIGILVDLTTITPTMSVYIGGTLVGSVDLPGGQVWYPAVTVGNDEAYSLRAFVNCGQRAFAALPADVDGWGVNGFSPGGLFFCPVEHGGFTTAPTDSVPLITYQPRILNANGFTIVRKCTVWPWGSRSEGATYSAIEIDNADGSYDFLIGQDRRDETVTVVETTLDGSYNSGTVLATAVVDKIEALGEQSIRITLKDKLTALERPIQQRLFPPFVDSGIENTPWPILLGACRNVNPILYDQVNRFYALHDDAITNIAAARDKGALLDPHASPPQYVPINDLQGIQLETLPVGLLTVDASSEGTQVLIPGAADIFNGEGIFDVWPNPAAPPPNWTFSVPTGSGSLVRSAYPAPQNYSATMSTNRNYYPANGNYGSHLRYDAVQLQPGKSYRVQFKLVRTQGNPGTPMQPGLMVRAEAGATFTELAAGAVTPNMTPLTTVNPFGQQETTYTFSYTCPPGSTRYLYFICTCGRLNSGLPPSGFALVQFHGVKVELLGDAIQTLPLTGIRLKPYMYEILQARGKLTSAEWSEADCDAIDSATKYEFGVSIKEAATIKEAAKTPLDSYCAAMFSDNLGRARFRRLVDPSNVPDNEIVAFFDETNAVYNVNVKLDLAPGLTSSAGVRRNWHIFGDSDFVTDYFAVPAAVRTQFKRASQLIVNSARTPSPTYRFALNAPPLDSLFDDPASGQAEVDRIFYPYTIGRIAGPNDPVKVITTVPRFIEFTALYEGIPPLLLFGDVIKLTYPRFGLDDGQKLAVVDTTLNPFNKTLSIVAWGSR